VGGQYDELVDRLQVVVDDHLQRREALSSI
jgi:hypothetical protein